MATYVEVSTHDGLNMPALYVEANKSDAPNLILIQEIFGINQAMKSLALMWAHKGFNVICPDLFWRQMPGLDLDPTVQNDFAMGKKLKAGLDIPTCIKDVNSAGTFLLNKHENQQIAAIGYCMGGTLVIRLAATSKINCAISYYGVGLEDVLNDLPDTMPPCLFHVAELDQQVPTIAREMISQHSDSREGWQHHTHEGCDHAFSRPGGESFDEQADEFALDLSLDFLTKHIK